MSLCAQILPPQELSAKGPGDFRMPYWFFINGRNTSTSGAVYCETTVVTLLSAKHLLKKSHPLLYVPLDKRWTWCPLAESWPQIPSRFWPWVLHALGPPQLASFALPSCSLWIFLSYLFLLLLWAKTGSEFPFASLVGSSLVSSLRRFAHRRLWGGSVL